MMAKKSGRGGLLGFLGTLLLLYVIYHLAAVYVLPALGVSAELPTIDFGKESK